MDLALLVLMINYKYCCLRVNEVRLRAVVRVSQLTGRERAFKFLVDGGDGGGGDGDRDDCDGDVEDLSGGNDD